jgi:hypothetical protein
MFDHARERRYAREKGVLAYLAAVPISTAPLFLFVLMSRKLARCMETLERSEQAGRIFLVESRAVIANERY